jgi:hypothetical protein
MPGILRPEQKAGDVPRGDRQRCRNRWLLHRRLSRPLLYPQQVSFPQCAKHSRLAQEVHSRQARVPLPCLRFQSRRSSAGCQLKCKTNHDDHTREYSHSDLSRPSPPGTVDQNLGGLATSIGSNLAAICLFWGRIDQSLLLMAHRRNSVGRWVLGSACQRCGFPLRHRYPASPPAGRRPPRWR